MSIRNWAASAALGFAALAASLLVRGDPALRLEAQPASPTRDAGAAACAVPALLAGEPSPVEASRSPAPPVDAASVAEAEATAREPIPERRTQGVRPCSHGSGHSLRHPGPLEKRGESAARDRGEDEVWVAAPRTAWTRATQARSARSDPAPAADLIVRVAGRADSDRLRVHVIEGADSVVACSGALHESELTFDALPAGSYRVELGGVDPAVGALDEVGVTAAAGTTAVVALTSALPPPLPFGRVRGTVVLADEFALLDVLQPIPLELVLRAETRDAEQRRRGMEPERSPLDPLGATELWEPHRAFELGPVPPGDYVLDLQPLGCRQRVRVEPGCTLDVEIAVPPPALTWIESRALQDRAGALRARLSASIDVGHGPPAPVWLDPRPGDGGAVAISVPGTLCVSLDHDSLAAGPACTTVTAGWNAIHVRARPAGRVRLEWPEGIVAAPWDAIRVEPLSQDGAVIARSIAHLDERLELVLAAECEYRIHGVVEASSARLAPPVVSIAAGERKTIVVAPTSRR